MDSYGPEHYHAPSLQYSYIRPWMYNSSLADEQGSDAISFGCYPYVYYSNTVNHRSIALPHNLSDLNDIFSVPLNRHGLYRDCSEGFGPSLINIGLLMKTVQRTGMGGCCTSYLNLFLQLSLYSHTLNLYHICTNELLCHFQTIGGNCSLIITAQSFNGRSS